MNKSMNEKQLIPIKKILLYTFIIGIILMILAYASGIITIGTDSEDGRFGVDTESTENVDPE